MSWLCIELGAWFTSQDALYASERIFYFVNQARGDRRLPVSHHIQVGASTISRLADIVKTAQCSLSDAIKISAEWEHFWSVYFSMPGGGTPRAGAASMLPDADSSIKKAWEASPQYKKMQSERGRAMAQATRPNPGVSLRPNPETSGEEQTSHWCRGRPGVEPRSLARVEVASAASHPRCSWEHHHLVRESVIGQEALVWNIVRNLAISLSATWPSGYHKAVALRDQLAQEMVGSRWQPHEWKPLMV